MFVLKASSVFVLAASSATDIYNQPVSTLKGCECKSACRPGALVNPAFYCAVSPYCIVKSKKCAKGTAEWSWTKLAHIDWCTFEPYKDYEDLKAEAKKELVLAHVNSDKKSGTYPSTGALVTGIMSESVKVSFDASADIFPQKRTKFIHSVGVTGGIRFNSNGDHPYTGLFKGAEHGVIRMSSAKAVSAGSGVAPGMGVKFFRDGRPSANFVAMYSLDGQPTGETNFFQHAWNNHIGLSDNAGLQFLAKKFWQASYCPLMVGLSDLSADEHGKPGKFPFKLNFQSSINSPCYDKDYAGCLNNLEKLPVGTKLFDVRAQADPDAKEVLIGNITITESLTTSKFGDEQLFFRHQYMEEDYQLKPQWLESINKKTDCGMAIASTQVPPISKGCRSPFVGLSSMANETKHMLQDDVTIV